jgi:hypothetical protein
VVPVVAVTELLGSTAPEVGETENEKLFDGVPSRGFTTNSPPST